MSDSPDAGPPAMEAGPPAMEPAAFDADTVRRMATLARLRLADDEVAPLVEHFGRMMEFVTVLEEADDPSVPPFRLDARTFDDLRPDTPIPPGERGAPVPPEAWRRNAPECDGRYFTVPRVVGAR